MTAGATPSEVNVRRTGLDKNDIISLVEAYIESKKPKFGGSIQIEYREVDKELGINQGATKRHINAAVRNLGYQMKRKGNTIAVIDTPPDAAVA